MTSISIDPPAGFKFEAVLPNEVVVDHQGQGFAAGSPDPSAPVSGSFRQLAGVVVEKITWAGTGSIAAAA